MVQRRHAHVRHAGQVLDAQRLAIIVLDPVDGLRHLVRLAAGQRHVAQARADGAIEQAVSELAADQWRQGGDFPRFVEQAHEAQHGVEQLGRHVADGNAARGRQDFLLRRAFDGAFAVEQRGHVGDVDAKHDAQMRLVHARFHHAHLHGQVDGRQQILHAAVMEGFASQGDVFRPLRDDRHAGTRRMEQRFRHRRLAVETEVADGRRVVARARRVAADQGGDFILRRK